MSCTTIKMKRVSKTGLEEISKRVIDDLSGDYVAAELVFQQLSDVNGTHVLLMIFERHYIRTGGMVVATIQIIDSGEEQTAIVAGTGGSSGGLGISFGANENFAKRISKALEMMGFK